MTDLTISTCCKAQEMKRGKTQSSLEKSTNPQIICYTSETKSNCYIQNTHCYSSDFKPSEFLGDYKLYVFRYQKRKLDTKPLHHGYLLKHTHINFTQSPRYTNSNWSIWCFWFRLCYCGWFVNNYSKPYETCRKF